MSAEETGHASSRSSSESLGLESGGNFTVGRLENRHLFPGPGNFWQPVEFVRLNIRNIFHEVLKPLPTAMFRTFFQFCIRKGRGQLFHQSHNHQPVERHGLCPRQFLRAVTDRLWQFDLNGAHDLFSKIRRKSCGLITLIPYTSASAKSRMLCVTINRARAATASSRMKSSPGSRRNGRSRK